MQQRFILVSAILTLFHFQSSSQVIFQKSYNLSSNYMGFINMIPAAGGGYMVAGGSIATNNNDDAWLVKVNATGDTLWTRSFGDATGTQNSSRFNSIVQLNTGGFFLAGSSEGFGNSWDFYLVVTDGAGDTLWTRSINDPMSSLDYCFSALVATDGNFITFGHRGGFEADLYLSKNDPAGNIIWTKGYSRPGDQDLGYSICQTSDEGFIMAGSTQNSVSVDVLIVKTDSAGNLLWSKTYSGPGFDEAKKIVQTQDGGYIIGGATQSFGAGGRDVLLIRTNSLGDTLWSRTIGDANFNDLSSLRQTPDSGFVLVGTSFNPAFGTNHVLMVKTDFAGNLLWSMLYGTSSLNTAGKDVLTTADGGYLACGAINGYGYLIKTDANGSSGCNEAPVVLTQGYAPLTVSSVSVNVATGSSLRKPHTIAGRGGQVNSYCLSNGLGNPLPDPDISVFPNPSSGNMNFTLSPECNSGMLELYDVIGISVLSLAYESSDFALDKPANAPGIYFYRISDRTGKTFVGKVVFE